MVASSTLWQYGGYSVGVAWLVREWITNTRAPPQSRAVGAKKKTDRYPGWHKDLAKVLRICFTTWRSKESFLLYGFVFVLLLRTYLSLIVADIDGFLVKNLINKDKQQMIKGLMMWLAIALPSSFINALIKYLQSRLSLALRSKLTEHVRELYFKDGAYFRISHLDKTVPNPEAAMTENIAQWSDRCAEVLSSLGKPLIDLVLFTGVLFRTLGFANQFLASVAVWESGKLMKTARPNYANVVEEKSALEAGLRFQHTRVIAASEEIAFCRGDQREKELLDTRFESIVKYAKRILREQIFFHTIEDFMTKYVWTAIGLVQVAVPLLQRGTTPGENAKYFITSKRVMTKCADATERLLVGIKDVHEFAGYTRIVQGMITALKQAGDDQRANREAQRLGGAASAIEASTCGDIVMKDVPIVTPTGETLIRSISLELHVGDRVMILGPNGSGKSSIFRVLCGLWPLRGGHIVKPSDPNDIYFLPQRPYLVQGTFRDQIIYPDSKEELLAKGVTDADLLKCLEKVLLGSVVEAHGGLDAVKEWGEVLSGGEKQRLGLSRVFYHKPKYAILDECSSAINVEAEQTIFENLLAQKISLITISHRHTLFKFHTKLLTLDGEGGFGFSDLRQSDLDKLTDKKEGMMRDLSRVLKDLGEDWPKNLADALGDE
jgi:ATP-binding cassette subfamily D (ALD) long-chain fatty acid import protein